MSEYIGIRSEGGLLPYDILDQIAKGELPGQQAKDFGLDSGRRVTDEIARAWSDAQDYWHIFQRRAAGLPEGETGTTVTREKWVIPLLTDLLGYELTYQPAGVIVAGKNYPVSHRAGEGEESPPIHVEGFRIDLDRRPEGRRLSPQALLQEYLNNSEDHVWGLVTNGLRLRLLRDTSRTARPTYLEFDLESILEGNRFNEFAVFYRVCHRTRLPRTAEDSTSCWLEKWFQTSIEQGGRVRDKLRDGVEAALKLLGTGLLRHPKNTELQERARSGRLTPQEFHRQLLRLVYRLLFLMVAEERRMIVPQGPEAERRQRLYDRYYSVARLRTLAEKPIERSSFGDLWIGLQQTFALFEDTSDSNALGIPPLNGDLFGYTAIKDLRETHLHNDDLLAAIRYVSLFEERRVRQRINYAALDVEELGSVYESLLDYQPVFTEEQQGMTFDLPTGSERRSTGSYYTHPELVQELIDAALVPVMEDRLKEVSEKDAQQEKTKKEQAILGMTVCDPACGSGHFLLAAARRLGRELARVRTGEEEPTPKEFHLAVRDVIGHCLYGVDKNPLAVDLCKVALWLEGHWVGKPLTFLDHRIRCGDSLVGVLDPSAMTHGIPDEAFEPVSSDNRKVASALRKRNRQERKSWDQRGFAFDAEAHVPEYAQESREFAALTDDSAAMVRKKEQIYSSLRSGMQRSHDQMAADLWTAQFFQPLTIEENPEICTTADFFAFAKDKSKLPRQVGAAEQLAQRHRFFHWFLEFPEIAEAGGFDVVIGNPPFLGGLKISENFGLLYRKYLDGNYAPISGKADLCAIFYRRTFNALRGGAYLAMVATNTISQGDTRESGLAVIVRDSGAIGMAHRFVKWPGDASVEVNLLAIRKGRWVRARVLDGVTVPYISSRLDDEPEIEPVRIVSNKGKAFQGSIVLGLGFVLDPKEAAHLIEKEPRNKECLFPYLTGEDLNSRYDLSASRWVIQFGERAEDKARSYEMLWQIVHDRVWPERKDKDAHKYPRMVNEWWKHWNNRQELYETIKGLNRVLVRSRVSELHMLAFVPGEMVFADAIVIFAFEDNYHFSVLQSNVHEAWLRRQASTMRTDIRYTPTDCFETFPFPQPGPEAKAYAESIGLAYLDHRLQTMVSRKLGLTKTYNLFHDPDCLDTDIARLRELHKQMDNAVLGCYGWADLDLGHGFYQNDREQTRFTVSPQARRELLRRLLDSNRAITTQEKTRYSRQPGLIPA